MDILIKLLDTSAVQTLIIMGAVFVGGKLFGKFPKLKKFYDNYRGEMIRVIKLVEAEIPDTTDNKSLHKLDRALQYMIVLIEKRENRSLSLAEKSEIRNNLSEVHHEIEPAMIAKKPTSV